MFDAVKNAWLHDERLTEEGGRAHACLSKIKINLRKEGYSTPLKATDGLRMLYVMDGSCTVQVRHQRHAMTAHAGETMLIAGGLVTRINSSEDALFLEFVYHAQDIRALCYSVTAEYNYVHRYVVEHVDDRQPILLETAGNTAFEAAIQGVVTAYLDRTVIEETLFDAASTYLAAQILSVLRDRMMNQVDADAQQRIMVEVLSHIESDIQHVSLYSEADRLGMDQSYLSRIVKKNMGRGFNDLVQSERMRRAAAMLTRSELPLAAITDEVGYANVSYFCKLFKTVFGKTPIEFRKTRNEA